uniref:C-type lectin domain-containing protein n=1 Tax=Maylandia zebra TaxID=106582 RepID=A0A3P9CLB4_9CICH
MPVFFSWHRIIGDVLGGVCFCSQGCLLCRLSGYVVVCQFQSGQCDRQFHFVTQSKTWTEAQLYCREKYTDLATFTSKDETMAAQRLVGSQKFWIGLFRVWKWKGKRSLRFIWLKISGVFSLCKNLPYSNSFEKQRVLRLTSINHHMVRE